MLLDKGDSASIVHIDILLKYHRILKQKQYKWSTMTGTFNTTSVTEIKLKLIKKQPRKSTREPFDQ